MTTGGSLVLTGDLDDVVRFGVGPAWAQVAAVDAGELPWRPTVRTLASRGAGDGYEAPGRDDRRMAPGWYRNASHSGTVGGVSTQIAVRLPEELVEFIDRLVSDGRAPSRAAVVSQALQRERRRELAARDAAILAAATEDDDLDGLAEHVARTPLDDLD